MYDAFFKSDRGMTEVGLDARPEVYFFKALESGEPHACMPWRNARGRCRCQPSKGWLCASGYRRRLVGKLHQYLELQRDALPKSPSSAPVRYGLNQREALTRFLEDGELEIDNGGTERANRGIALGGN